MSAVIILCAGKSKRMKTRKSKVLHAILGKPMIFYSVELAERLKPEKIILVIGKNGEDIKRALTGKKVEFAVQDPPLGTADAVRCALPLLKGLKGSALILYADNPLLTYSIIKKLIGIKNKTKSKLALLTTKFPEPPAFGRILRDQKGEIVDIIEDADATQAQKKIKEVNAGVYCLDIEFLKKAIEKIRPLNLQKEFYLTDLVKVAVKEKLKISSLLAQDHSETIGINSREELVQALSALKLRINHYWLENGVTIEEPSRVWIGPEVKIGQDTVIEPEVRIFGSTRIGKNCKIQAGTRIVDSIVEDGVEILQNSVIEDSRIKTGSVIGPMAHLRPGSVIGRNVRIGNFVELKNTRIGDGTKSAHLTYLGDAVVGKNVNIGCGTITCNYDGVKKWRTTIEDEVFVGSDTQLVAPVRVGKGAYIGSGSTITEDVPAFALAIGRGKQIIKPRWIKKRKELLKKQTE